MPVGRAVNRVERRRLVWISAVGLLVIFVAIAAVTLAYNASGFITVAEVEETIRAWGAWGVMASIGLMIVHEMQFAVDINPVGTDNRGAEIIFRSQYGLAQLIDIGFDHLNDAVLSSAYELGLVSGMFRDPKHFRRLGRGIDVPNTNYLTRYVGLDEPSLFRI